MPNYGSRTFRVDIGTIDGEEHRFYATYSTARTQFSDSFRELDAFDFEYNAIIQGSVLQFTTAMVWTSDEADQDEEWKHPVLLKVVERQATVTIDPEKIAWVRTIYLNEGEELEDDEEA